MSQSPPRKKQAIGWPYATSLPGFGLPLGQTSGLHTARDWYASPLTVRERSMLALMAALKDKPEWSRKVFDEDIVSRWKEEALAIDSSMSAGNTADNGGSEPQQKLSEKIFDHCVAELRDNAKTFQERGYTEALDANACVYMSDTAIDAKTKAALRKGVARLEDVKDIDKDWHPGSDGKVLDLVHPSLFPLVYGRSRILTDGKVPLQNCSEFTGKGEIVPDPTALVPSSLIAGYSGKFQWLPCEVAMTGEGKASIVSYINNLHPDGNGDIYAAVEDVIAAATPLWIDAVLSTKFLARHRLHHEHEGGWIEKQKSGDGETDEEEGEVDIYGEYFDEDFKPEVPEPRDNMPRRRVLREVFEAPDGTEMRLVEIGAEIKKPYKQPTEAQIQQGQEAMKTEANRIRTIFQQQGLQVIVKLASIHLSPDKPTFPGGGWHIEGQLNEHIVASALYYYDSSNITDSHLAFREGVDRDELNGYEQGRFQALLDIYGIPHADADAVQPLGRVLTREDRLLVFPNVLQHRVSPFALRDPAQPGHRKLLALFLVDPDIRIPSTANVPPQQMNWWRGAVEASGCRTNALPIEIADQVFGFVDDFCFSLEEARELRERLMEERRNREEDVMEPYVENGYAFCEH